MIGKDSVLIQGHAISNLSIIWVFFVEMLGNAMPISIEIMPMIIDERSRKFRSRDCNISL